MVLEQQPSAHNPTGCRWHPRTSSLRFFNMTRALPCRRERELGLSVTDAFPHCRRGDKSTLIVRGERDKSRHVTVVFHHFVWQQSPGSNVRLECAPNGGHLAGMELTKAGRAFRG